MLRVLVAVKRHGDLESQDLEVPAEVEALQLAQDIALAMGWEGDDPEHPMRFRIRADGLERVLESDETLRDVGVWDGARLVLVPKEEALAEERRVRVAEVLEGADLDTLARKAETLERLGRAPEAVAIYRQLVLAVDDAEKRREWEAALQRLNEDDTVGEGVMQAQAAGDLAALEGVGGRLYPVTQGRARVGRDSERDGIYNEVDLTPEEGSGKVSRRQFRLEHRHGRWYLQVEAGAKNPTTVRGKEVPEGEDVRLSNGDEIRISKLKLIFRTQKQEESPDKEG